MIEKVCLVCSKSFTVPDARKESAKTCSPACAGKLTTARYAATRVEKVCPVCGKAFLVPQCHAERRECCSIRCANKHPDRKRSTGANHYLWNGGQSEHSDGYLYIRTENHPFSGNQQYVLEHRVVLENFMRVKAPDHRFLVEHGGVLYLRPEISVHHINGNKRDNQLKNLVACTRSAHRSIHEGKAPMQGETWPEKQGLPVFTPYKVLCTCKQCGAQFLKKRHDVDRGSGKFCTRACYLTSLATK